MKKVLFYFSVLCFGSMQAQENCSTDFNFSVDTTKAAQPFNHLAFQNDPCRFQFAIVTDRTGGHRPGVFMDGVNKLNLMQPEFVMSVGDLIEGYTLDTIELARQWNEFNSFVGHLQMPFFYVPGNHDITNAVMEKEWLSRFGSTYYHFTYKDVLFLCLNSEDQQRGAGHGTISDAQFEYAAKVLKDNPDVRWTLIFMHQPLWHQRNTVRWQELEALLGDRNHTVYAGHEHRYVKEKRNNGKYFTLATTGGGSGLRGPKLGEFDHMMWVTMTDQGPIMANLALDGIWTEDVVTQDTKNLIEKFSAHSPIEIEPLFFEGERFESGSLGLKITNDENVPMRLNFRTQNSPNLALFADSSQISVAPNSVAFMNLKLLSQEGDSLIPAQLFADLELGAEGEPAHISYPYVYRIKPLRKRALKQCSQKPKVDGSTQEWGAMSYAFERNAGTVKVEFDLAYDEQYVYVAARVTDDTIQSYGGGATWQQDNLSFVANAEKMGRSAVSVGHDWYAQDFVQQLSPANDTTPSVAYRNNLPKGTKMICRQTDYGYEGELALPISYIQSFQGENWQYLRLNVGIDDKDGGEVVRYSWLPIWRNADNYVGSGYFFRVEEKR
ncbi:metallophosphoesterase [Croceimicrobium hydrocarbonivorans]|uniref:Metallophosphoesterase n=1 Tax=Croceimicrobium hydrocarbonivorans TaxID=2761580 RepID=A0A7H0VJ59_9FLAO|nr:metallophosphoesterase [Croceimicrobium hydrocarbonivorans]QNR25757.1 metallophosphoesterase [Croceimicrobium hydrocarbonivorans]